MTPQGVTFRTEAGGVRARRVAAAGTASACYFRSGPPPGARKALLKITDRCDLHCAHCFVSATRSGSDMALADLRTALPRLAEARVRNVTLTGGEPLVHPDFPDFLTLLAEKELDVTVCTNAVSLTDSLLGHMVGLGCVEVNVSLDGFSPDSHGRFRGDRGSFEKTVRHTKRLAAAGILKGVLSTPNSYASPDEYAELFDFADDQGAQYVLLNPLSSFGRGIRTRGRLAADENTMRHIQRSIEARAPTAGAEAVFIRFPNETQPLSGCIAGDIFYVQVDGRTTVCPYLLFAAESPDSKHDAEEFVVGNLFRDPDFAKRLDGYSFIERYALGGNDTCASCSIGGSCGKGCPAAVVTAGGRIGDLDQEVCPVVSRSSGSTVAVLRRRSDLGG